MPIDNVDFMILRCIQRADSPLWKNEIYKCQSDIVGETVSIQTVGRRVDRLRDEGYLDSCIVSPENIKRDLIIAFKLTERGQETIEERRKELLLEEVNHNFFSRDGEAPLSYEALVKLVSDEFDLDSSTRAMLLGDYEREELVTLLTTYFVRDRIEEVFDENDGERFRQLSSISDKFMDSPA